MIVFTRRQCYFLFALLASAVGLQAQATLAEFLGPLRTGREALCRALS